jgi:Na+/H+-dicarboxylate symporter
VKKTILALLVIATLALGAGCSAQSSAAPQTRSDAATSATPQTSGPAAFDAPTFQT